MALSLVEAETIRRIMHVTGGTEVVDGAAVDLALRILPADNALMDSTVSSQHPPTYQAHVTHQAWRFFDRDKPAITSITHREWAKVN